MGGLEKFVSTEPGVAALRDLLATLDLGIAMARDPDGTIAHWSQGCERLYGWQTEEAVGQICHDLLQTEFPIPLNEIEATLRQRGEWNGELHQRTRDGRRIVVSVRKVLRRNDAGTPIAVMESIADVTAQRAAETLVAERNAQLAHVAKMEALGRLAGGIAHDFNNVLQTVQACIELAVARGPADASQIERMLRIAHAAALRGITVTKRLLSFARQDNLQASPIDPAALLGGIADMLRATIGAPYQFNVEVEPGLPPLLADPGQVETVIVNLANNARDAMPQGGTITFRAEPANVSDIQSPAAGLAAGHFVRISVIDHGKGMRPEVLARSSEPFFTTKQRGAGTGLGLAMARGFAEQSGGALTIASAPGRGTNVSLWLPEAPESVLIAGEGETKLLATETTGLARVLLAEDDEAIREILVTALSERGYVVAAAEHAAGALEFLKHGFAPDALITDLAMPGTLDGLDLVIETRRRLPRLPAMLVTGHLGQAQPAKVEQAKSGGPFALLQKPTSMHALLSNLSQLLTAA